MTRAAQDEQGQSLVEFALMLPVLVILLVGTIDVARGLQAYVSVANAVREGAREAAVHGSASGSQWGPAANDANVVTAVRGRVAGIPTQDIAVTSSWPSGNNARGSEVVVAASHTFRPIAFAFVGGATMSFSSTTRMRILR